MCSFFYCSIDDTMMKVSDSSLARSTLLKSFLKPNKQLPVGFENSRGL